MQQSDSAADFDRDDTTRRLDELQGHTNKRLTLNLLIQGAAMHTFLTAHHLVQEELDAISPRLTRWYDKLAISLSLNYFIGDTPLLYGLPSRFWNRTQKPSHPFHQHELLANHGHELWLASKRYLMQRGWKKHIVGIPFFHYLQMWFLLAWVALKERGKGLSLARVAEYANSLIWNIDPDRLDAALTTQVAFGNLRVPKTVIGRITRHGAIGYGGVELRDGQFHVVAKSWSWPLVIHELTKGTVELIFLHGLNKLDEETYEKVTDFADQLEFETWTMQAGAEMWRRLLAAIPESQTLSETLMHIARLDPAPFEQLMTAVVDDQALARVLLEELG